MSRRDVRQRDSKWRPSTASPQTALNRLHDVRTLQHLIELAGLAARIDYDDTRGKFVVADADGELIAGRYEVVWAYLKGFIAGRVLKE